MNSVMRKIRELKLLYRRRRVLMGILSLFACGALLGTSYLLIQPAVTMTDGAFCGLAEHVHTDACYSQEVVCPLDEHVHSDDCYDGDGNLVCTILEHEHTADCFDTVLTCTEPEHTHTLACYSDSSAVETEDDIAKYFKHLDTTDDWGADCAAAASAMVGYAERTDNYSVCDDGATVKGYTFFGDCAGTPYADWNVLFADFCLDMANVSEDVFPRADEAADWVAAIGDEGYYSDDLSNAYVGDLAFTDSDDDGAVDRVGVITAIDGDEFTVVEGDSGDAVAELTYTADDIICLGMVTACQDCSDVIAQLDTELETAYCRSWDGDGESDASTGQAYLDKNIRANEDGTFTLRLSAYVTGKTVVTYDYTPVDVVLILDTSGSMDDDDAVNADGDDCTRMEALQEAAETFIKEIARVSPKGTYEDNGANMASRVAVVEFNYWRTLQWTGTDSEQGTTKIVQALTAVKDTAGSDTTGTLVTKINGLSGKTATATEPFKSFDLAYDILYNDNSDVNTTSSGTTRTDRKKVVVFFTDGDPSPRQDGFGFDATNKYDTEYKNYDQFSVYENANRTVAKANKLKAAGATVYTIGLVTDSNYLSSYSETEAFMDAVSSNNTSGALMYDLTVVYKEEQVQTWDRGRPSWKTEQVAQNLVTTTQGYGASGTTTVVVPYTGSKQYTIDTGAENTYRYTSNSMVDDETKQSNILSAFTSVAHSVVQLSMNLGTTTILKDIITDEFFLESDQAATVVNIYTQAATYVPTDTNGNVLTEDIQWGALKEIEDDIKSTSNPGGLTGGDVEWPVASVVLADPDVPDSKSTIAVTGFDYSTHWIGATDSSGTPRVEGRRLVVDIEINSTEQNVGNPNVKSNDPSSGIYNGDTPVSNFTPPYVPFPSYADIEVKGASGATVAVDIADPLSDSNDQTIRKAGINSATFTLPYATTGDGFAGHADLSWDVIEDTTLETDDWGDTTSLTVLPATNGQTEAVSARMYAKLNLMNGTTEDTRYAAYKAKYSDAKEYSYQDGEGNTVYYQAYDVTWTIPAGYTAEYYIYNGLDETEDQLLYNNGTWVTDGGQRLARECMAITSSADPQTGIETGTATLPTDHYYKVVIVLSRTPTLKFTKYLGVAGDCEPLEGITFTVVHDDSRCNYSDTDAYDGTDISYTETSNEDGVVEFDQLAPGHTYIMTETVPDTLLATYTKYRIVATETAYTVTPLNTDGVAQTGEAWTSGGESGLCIYNQRKLITYTIHTVVTGSNPNGTFPYTITYKDSLGSSVPPQITYTPSGAASSVTEALNNQKFGNGGVYTFTVPYGSTDLKVQTSDYTGYYVSVTKTGGTAALSDAVNIAKVEVDGEYTFTFTTGYTLPNTGGNGSILLYTLGGLFLTAAAAGFALRRKRERRAE